jgi:hypothetical protein
MGLVGVSPSGASGSRDPVRVLRHSVTRVAAEEGPTRALRTSATKVAAEGSIVVVDRAGALVPMSDAERNPLRP